MMVILSEQEYNDLLKKAHSLELLVEERVQQEQAKLQIYFADQLQKCVADYQHHRDPKTFVLSLQKAIEHLASL